MKKFAVVSLFFLASFAHLAYAETDSTATTDDTVIVNEQPTASDGPTVQYRPAPTPQGTGANITLVNPLNLGNCTSNNTCISAFVAKLLQLVIKIGTIVIIFMLVYVGYLFVAAQGVPGKIEEARKALLWTVVGALILLGAEAIAKGIEATVKAISVGQ